MSYLESRGAQYTYIIIIIHVVVVAVDAALTNLQGACITQHSTICLKKNFRGNLGS